MKRIYLLAFIFIGCVKSPHPISYIDKAELSRVGKVSYEVTNATETQEITPTVEKALKDELMKLKRYSGEADASIECVITDYVGYEEKIAPKEKHVSYDVEEFEREGKSKEGCATSGCLFPGMPTKSTWVTGHESYEYGKVTKSPTIGLEVSLTKNDKVVYKGNKFFSSHSRIPGCYFTSYNEFISPEQLNSTSFVAGLAVKELLDPLMPKPLGYKSTGMARLFSGIIPGTGEFYIRNYFKGVLDFGIEALLIGGALYCNSKIENAPEEREGDEFGTKGDYILSTWLLGLSAAAYHIYQVIRVGDDAIVYNYKRKFIKSPVKVGFDGTKCVIYLSKAF